MSNSQKFDSDDDEDTLSTNSRSFEEGTVNKNDHSVDNYFLESQHLIKIKQELIERYTNIIEKEYSDVYGTINDNNHSVENYTVQTKDILEIKQEPSEDCTSIINNEYSDACDYDENVQLEPPDVPEETSEIENYCFDIKIVKCETVMWDSEDLIDENATINTRNDSDDNVELTQSNMPEDTSELEDGLLNIKIVNCETVKWDSKESINENDTKNTQNKCIEDIPNNGAQTETPNESITEFDSQTNFDDPSDIQNCKIIVVDGVASNDLEKICDNLKDLLYPCGYGSHKSVYMAHRPDPANPSLKQLAAKLETHDDAVIVCYGLREHGFPAKLDVGYVVSRNFKEFSSEYSEIRNKIDDIKSRTEQNAPVTTYFTQESDLPKNIDSSDQTVNQKDYIQNLEILFDISSSTNRAICNDIANGIHNYCKLNCETTQEIGSTTTSVQNCIDAIIDNNLCQNQDLRTKLDYKQQTTSDEEFEKRVIINDCYQNILDLRTKLHYIHQTTSNEEIEKVRKSFNVWVAYSYKHPEMEPTAYEKQYSVLHVKNWMLKPFRPSLVREIRSYGYKKFINPFILTTSFVRNDQFILIPFSEFLVQVATLKDAVDVCNKLKKRGFDAETDEGSGQVLWNKYVLGRAKNIEMKITDSCPNNLISGDQSHQLKKNDCRIICLRNWSSGLIDLHKEIERSGYDVRNKDINIRKTGSADDTKEFFIKVETHKDALKIIDYFQSRQLNARLDVDDVNHIFDDEDCQYISTTMNVNDNATNTTNNSHLPLPPIVKTEKVMVDSDLAVDSNNYMNKINNTALPNLSHLTADDAKSIAADLNNPISFKISVINADVLTEKPDLKNLAVDTNKSINSDTDDKPFTKLSDAAFELKSHSTSCGIDDKTKPINENQSREELVRNFNVYSNITESIVDNETWPSYRNFHLTSEAVERLPEESNNLTNVTFNDSTTELSYLTAYKPLNLKYCITTEPAVSIKSTPGLNNSTDYHLNNTRSLKQSPQTIKEFAVKSSLEGHVNNSTNKSISSKKNCNLLPDLDVKSDSNYLNISSNCHVNIQNNHNQNKHLTRKPPGVIKIKLSNNSNKCKVGETITSLNQSDLVSSKSAVTINVSADVKNASKSDSNGLDDNETSDLVTISNCNMTPKIEKKTAIVLINKVGTAVSNKVVYRKFNIKEIQALPKNLNMASEPKLYRVEPNTNVRIKKIIAIGLKKASESNLDSDRLPLKSNRNSSLQSCTDAMLSDNIFFKCKVDNETLTNTSNLNDEIKLNSWSTRKSGVDIFEANNSINCKVDDEISRNKSDLDKESLLSKSLLQSSIDSMLANNSINCKVDDEISRNKSDLDKESLLSKPLLQSSKDSMLANNSINCKVDDEISRNKSDLDKESLLSKPLLQSSIDSMLANNPTNCKVDDEMSRNKSDLDKESLLSKPLLQSSIDSMLTGDNSTNNNDDKETSTKKSNLDNENLLKTNLDVTQQLFLSGSNKKSQITNKKEISIKTKTFKQSKMVLSGNSKKRKLGSVFTQEEPECTIIHRPLILKRNNLELTTAMERLLADDYNTANESKFVNDTKSLTDNCKIILEPDTEARQILSAVSSNSTDCEIVEASTSHNCIKTLKPEEKAMLKDRPVDNIAKLQINATTLNPNIKILKLTRKADRKGRLLANANTNCETDDNNEMEIDTNAELSGASNDSTGCEIVCEISTSQNVNSFKNSKEKPVPKVHDSVDCEVDNNAKVEINVTPSNPNVKISPTTDMKRIFKITPKPVTAENKINHKKDVKTSTKPTCDETLKPENKPVMSINNNSMNINTNAELSDPSNESTDCEIVYETLTSENAKILQNFKEKSLSKVQDSVDRVVDDIAKVQINVTPSNPNVKISPIPNRKRVFKITPKPVTAKNKINHKKDVKTSTKPTCDETLKPENKPVMSINNNSMNINTNAELSDPSNESTDCEIVYETLTSENAKILQNFKEKSLSKVQDSVDRVVDDIAKVQINVTPSNPNVKISPIPNRKRVFKITPKPVTAKNKINHKKDVKTSTKPTCDETLKPKNKPVMSINNNLTNFETDDGDEMEIDTNAELFADSNDSTDCEIIYETLTSQNVKILQNSEEKAVSKVHDSVDCEVDNNAKVQINVTPSNPNLKISSTPDMKRIFKITPKPVTVENKIDHKKDVKTSTKPTCDETLKPENKPVMSINNNLTNFETDDDDEMEIDTNAELFADSNDSTDCEIIYETLTSQNVKILQNSEEKAISKVHDSVRYEVDNNAKVQINVTPSNPNIKISPIPDMKRKFKITLKPVNKSRLIATPNTASKENLQKKIKFNLNPFIKTISKSEYGDVKLNKNVDLIQKPDVRPGTPLTAEIIMNYKKDVKAPTKPNCYEILKPENKSVSINNSSMNINTNAELSAPSNDSSDCEIVYETLTSQNAKILQNFKEKSVSKVQDSVDRVVDNIAKVQINITPSNPNIKISPKPNRKRIFKILNIQNTAENKMNLKKDIKTSTKPNLKETLKPENKPIMSINNNSTNCKTDDGKSEIATNSKLSAASKDSTDCEIVKEASTSQNEENLLNFEKNAILTASHSADCKVDKMDSLEIDETPSSGNHNITPKPTMFSSNLNIARNSTNVKKITMLNCLQTNIRKANLDMKKTLIVKSNSIIKVDHVKKIISVAKSNGNNKSDVIDSGILLKPNCNFKQKSNVDEISTGNSTNKVNDVTSTDIKCNITPKPDNKTMISVNSNDASKVDIDRDSDVRKILLKLSRNNLTVNPTSKTMLPADCNNTSTPKLNKEIISNNSNYNISPERDTNETLSADSNHSTDCELLDDELTNHNCKKLLKHEKNGNQSARPNMKRKFSAVSNNERNPTLHKEIILLKKRNNLKSSRDSLNYKAEFDEKLTILKPHCNITRISDKHLKALSAVMNSSEKNSVTVSNCLSNALLIKTNKLSDDSNEASYPNLADVRKPNERSNLTGKPNVERNFATNPTISRKCKRSDLWKNDESEVLESYGLKESFLSKHNIELPLTSTVVVTNLPPDANESKLREVFSIAGGIKYINVKPDTAGQKNEAIIEFHHSVEAVQAVCMFHTSKLNNHVLKVAMEKSTRATTTSYPEGLTDVKPGLKANGKPLKHIPALMALQSIKEKLVQMKLLSKVDTSEKNPFRYQYLSKKKIQEKSSASNVASDEENKSTMLDSSSDHNFSLKKMALKRPIEKFGYPFRTMSSSQSSNLPSETSPFVRNIPGSNPDIHPRYHNSPVKIRPYSYITPQSDKPTANANQPINQADNQPTSLDIPAAAELIETSCLDINLDYLASINVNIPNSDISTPNVSEGTTDVLYESEPIEPLIQSKQLNKATNEPSLQASQLNASVEDSSNEYNIESNQTTFSLPQQELSQASIVRDEPLLQTIQSTKDWSVDEYTVLPVAPTPQVVQPVEEPNPADIKTNETALETSQQNTTPRDRFVLNKACTFVEFTELTQRPSSEAIEPLQQHSQASIVTDEQSLQTSQLKTSALEQFISIGDWTVNEMDEPSFQISQLKVKTGERLVWTKDRTFDEFIGFRQATETLQQPNQANVGTNEFALCTSQPKVSIEDLLFSSNDDGDHCTGVAQAPSSSSRDISVEKYFCDSSENDFDLTYVVL